MTPAEQRLSNRYQERDTEEANSWLSMITGAASAVGGFVSDVASDFAQKTGLSEDPNLAKSALAMPQGQSLPADAAKGLMTGLDLFLPGDKQDVAAGIDWLLRVLNVPGNMANSLGQETLAAPIVGGLRLAGVPEDKIKWVKQALGIAAEVGFDVLTGAGVTKTTDTIADAATLAGSRLRNEAGAINPTKSELGLPGAHVRQPTAAKHLGAKAAASDESVIYHARSGKNLAGQKQFAVAAFPKRSVRIESRAVTPEDIENFVKQNQDIFEGNSVSVTTRADQNGTWIDAVLTTPNRKKADTVAKRLGGKEVYDLSQFDPKTGIRRDREEAN
jgi:hypothetical protein